MLRLSCFSLFRAHIIKASFHITLTAYCRCCEGFSQGELSLRTVGAQHCYKPKPVAGSRRVAALYRVPRILRHSLYRSLSHTLMYRQELNSFNPMYLIGRSIQTAVSGRNILLSAYSKREITFYPYRHFLQRISLSQLLLSA